MWECLTLAIIAIVAFVTGAGWQIYRIRNDGIDLRFNKQLGKWECHHHFTNNTLKDKTVH